VTPLALYSADKSVSVQTHTYTHTHTHKQTNKQTNKQTTYPYFAYRHMWIISVSVLLVVRPKIRNVRWPCRMRPPGESQRVCQRDRQTDGQTDGCQIVILDLRFPLVSASVIINYPFTRILYTQCVSMKDVTLNLIYTVSQKRSSAIAEGPRDALC